LKNNLKNGLGLKSDLKEWFFVKTIKIDSRSFSKRSTQSVFMIVLRRIVISFEIASIVIRLIGLRLPSKEFFF